MYSIQFKSKMIFKYESPFDLDARIATKIDKAGETIKLYSLAFDFGRRIAGVKLCRGTKIRTWDPLLPKQVR